MKTMPVSLNLAHLPKWEMGSFEKPLRDFHK